MQNRYSYIYIYICTHAVCCEFIFAEHMFANLVIAMLNMTLQQGPLQYWVGLGVSLHYRAQFGFCDSDTLLLLCFFSGGKVVGHWPVAYCILPIWPVLQ